MQYVKYFFVKKRFAVTSVAVDFRRLYWLESFSASIYSIDKKDGQDVIQYPVRKRLTHIFAYSEGIQAFPGSFSCRLL